MEAAALQGWDLWAFPTLLYVIGLSLAMSALTGVFTRGERSLLWAARSFFWAAAGIFAAAAASYALAPPAVVDRIYVASAILAGLLAALGVLLDWWIAVLSRMLRRGRGGGRSKS